MIKAFQSLALLLSYAITNDGAFAFTPSSTYFNRWSTIKTPVKSLGVSKDIQPTASDPSTTRNISEFDPSLRPTEIDDNNNIPPSLQVILNSLEELKSGSDLRGTFTYDNSSGGTIASLANIIKQLKENGGGAALTPFASYCFGSAFSQWLLQREQSSANDTLTICVGRDPRTHGERLADAFARGAETVDGVRVVYTGIATTPSLHEFVRSSLCDAAVMITASHLPQEKNGLKFFSKEGSVNVDELNELAQHEARNWYDLTLPPPSGISGVLCDLVDFMPHYERLLAQSIKREVGTDSDKPLAGLNIVVNPGNGAGCFFNKVLADLGAQTRGSIHLSPDGTFPESFGVPNPEKDSMVQETILACKDARADIGIMFDTDSDRAGFVLPRNAEDGTWEPLHKNRLIALLGTIFSSSSPGCTIVTDSTTSEGLGFFLEDTLGLTHYRYLRGYANVINKAKELTCNGVNAEVAIETSGHCAMRENGYVDDGTYTAVKILGLLARTKASGEGSLLESIDDLEELDYDKEFRLKITDGSLDTTTSIFKEVTLSVKDQCGHVETWTLDDKNLEGVRVRLASGGFFMLRQSLHDPVISLQMEAISADEAEDQVISSMLSLLKEYEILDYSSMCPSDYSE